MGQGKGKGFCTRANRKPKYGGGAWAARDKQVDGRAQEAQAEARPGLSAACPSESRGREFPGGPVVRTLRFHCPGLMPGQGTKIPQAVQHGQKKKKETQGSL